MMHPETITTPFAGAERAAEVLGVSPARTRQLISLAKEALHGENGRSRVQYRAKKSHAKKNTLRRHKKTTR